MRAAIDAARAAVNSQIESRIGKNPVMQRQYGSGQQASGSGSAAAAHKVGDTITQNGHTYTVDEVDANGKVTKAH
jgi:hypothetical protein